MADDETDDGYYAKLVPLANGRWDVEVHRHWGVNEWEPRFITELTGLPTKHYARTKKKARRYASELLAAVRDYEARHTQAGGAIEVTS